MNDAPLRLRDGTEADHPAIVRIWRRAVEATHDFLTAADVERLERQVRAEVLPVLEITVAVRGDEVLGWAGAIGNEVDALFVDPAAHRQGVGTALLESFTAAMPVVTLDVNEQNPGARAFYEAHGFVQVGRSERDGDGRPFPLLHLRKG